MKLWEGVEESISNLLDSYSEKELIKIIQEQSQIRIKKLIELWKIPNIPKKWENNSKLVNRYNIFLEIIKSNQEWWETWQNKIELLDDGIDFKELTLVLSLNDLKDKKSLNELKEEWIISQVLNEKELGYIRNFIKLSPDKYKLLEFLDFELYSWYCSNEDKEWVGYTIALELPDCVLQATSKHAYCNRVRLIKKY